MRTTNDTVTFEPGQLVELHSLSREDLNGKRGYCTTWDASKDRWGLSLAGESKHVLAVRPSNLESPARPELSSTEAAEEAADRAASLLDEAEKGGSGASALFDQAESHLITAEVYDPGCTLMLQIRGDLAHMCGDHASVATWMLRAVANSRETPARTTATRMSLAHALGELEDFKGEEEQLRAVLEAIPGHIQARHHLGQNLSQSGRGAEAIPELLLALELPDESQTDTPKHGIKICRDDARSKLRGHIQQAYTAGDSARAFELLQRIIAVPGINADETSLFESELVSMLTKAGQIDEADKAAARAFAANATSLDKVGYAYHTAAECKEMRANMCADTTEKAALYDEALALVRRACEVHPDPASLQARGRIEAKKSYEQGGGGGDVYLGQEVLTNQHAFGPPRDT
jgi:hypothetical protein